MLIDQHIKETLTEAIKILFPLYDHPEKLVKPHIWRNRKYLGDYNGKVVVWKGWSANLVAIDFRYRAVFIDVVDNKLSSSERERLFGRDFAECVSGMEKFVVMFVLDFPNESVQDIRRQGFTPRIIGRAIHACVVASTKEFLDFPPLYWAAKVVRLVVLQRFLSIHRKPIDANEVPLQNLIYKTGYLHHYIVSNGLELNKLSRPRKAGDFGHDFHAVVRNSLFNPEKPFSIGIELYVSSMGYHVDTIPDYVNNFNLKGMIVIAKDDPFIKLQKVQNKFSNTIFLTQKLSDIGSDLGVAIHYLPLDKVTVDLASIRDELETLLPSVPIQS